MEKIKLLTRIFYLVVSILCIFFAFEHIYKIYQLEVKLVNQNLDSVLRHLKDKLKEEVMDGESTLAFMDNIIGMRLDGKVPFKEDELKPTMAPLIATHKNQYSIYFAFNEKNSKKYFQEKSVIFSVHKDKKRMEAGYQSLNSFQFEAFHGSDYQTNPAAVWYHEGKKSQKVEMTDIYYDQTMFKVWMFSLVKGIYRNNEFQGVIAVDFFLDSFLKNISKEMNLMHGTLAVMDNTTSRIFTHSENLKLSDYTNLTHGLVRQGLQNKKVTNKKNGEKYILNTFNLDHFNWTIVTLISQDAIYSEVFSKVKLLLAAASGLLFLTLFLGYLLFRNLNKFYFEVITQNQSRGITRLTEGLCHEINNPLATLSLCQGAIKRLLKRELDNSTINGLMTKSERASERIQVIIQKLQNISFTSADVDLKPTFMGDLVEELRMIFSEELSKHRISLSLYAPNGGVIICDPLKMLQCLMPLVENSIEEIQQQKEKWIRIEVEKSRNGSQIKFVDSGTGIKRGIQERIFLPFFTTKTKELKKGLGLTVAKSFIEQQGGTISYDSSAKFTTFRMNLPLTAPSLG